MRNVRYINHFVNNCIDGPLMSSNSKWLKLSRWVEVKNRNLDELLGVRIYCLELPYRAKINSENLVGLNLTWLVLKGGDSRNLQIDDSHIVEMLNRMEHFDKLEITCFAGEKLQEIQDKKKMRLLKIERMDVGANFIWDVIAKFERLQVMEISSVERRWNSRRMEESTERFVLPENLQTLKVGAYFDTTLLNLLPKSLTALTIENPNMRNSHTCDVPLPIFSCSCPSCRS